LSYYRLRISEIAPLLTTADGRAGRQDSGAAEVGLRSLVTHQFGATVGQSVGNHLVIASSMRLVRAGLTSATVPAGGTLDAADELAASLETSGDLDVGALAMVASWPKLQCVRAAVRPDVSRITRSSVAIASVLNWPVSMGRSSMRTRLARAAS
jgi:hypothetical protein